MHEISAKTLTTNRNNQQKRPHEFESNYQMINLIRELFKCLRSGSVFVDDENMLSEVANRIFNNLFQIHLDSRQRIGIINFLKEMVILRESLLASSDEELKQPSNTNSYSPEETLKINLELDAIIKKHQEVTAFLGSNGLDKNSYLNLLASC
ncbi:MAG: hypothetical protein ACOZAN_04520 [Patescibacteria group bacterium]